MTDWFEVDADAMNSARRSPAESGSISWATGDAIPTLFNTTVAESFQGMRIIARLEQDKPQQLSLHVRLSDTGSPNDFSAVAGFESLNVLGPCLVLMVEYGDLMGRHRLVADMRSGTYRLPACTFVQVYGMQWNGAGIAIGATASVTISRAIDTDPKLFTMTGYGDMLAAGTATIPIPFYAQFADLWATGWVGGIGAANAPILLAEDLGIYRDYTTGLFVPSWGPVSYSGDNVSNDSVTIENAGAATARVFLQFYLSP